MMAALALLKGASATRNGVAALAVIVAILTAIIGNMIGHYTGKRVGVLEYKADQAKQAGRAREKANTKARRADRPGSPSRLLKKWCRDC